MPVISSKKQDDLLLENDQLDLLIRYLIADTDYSWIDTGIKINSELDCYIE